MNTKLYIPIKQLALYIALYLFSITLSFGQSPDLISYQAIVRDASNDLVTNNVVGMQISILQGSATGIVVYSEMQNPTTNVNGLVSIQIGSGTVLQGDMSSIDWSSGPYFIKTETDPSGGNNYSIVGSSQLLSVPYALYAETAGNAGATGATGPQGPAGNDGADGIDGTNGIDGQDGSTGATGPQGPAGNDGADGIDGTNGIDGQDGATGATGPQGPAGNDGADGIDGINGIDGQDGATGATGPQGPAGNDGADGIDGTNGIDGQDGATGATGPQGPAGNDGADGIDGTNGIDGQDGATGATGPQGPAGNDGTDGIDGTNGIDGQDGATGATGPQGPAGNDGTDGIDGTNGIDGQDGATGATGPQGPAGNDGTDGIDGTNGIDGQDGATGATGPQGPAGGFQDGTSAGEMLYWDGNTWVAVSPSNNFGATLQSFNGVPMWTGGVPSINVGDFFQGGVVYYLFQPGDAGYVAGEQHGLIAALNDIPAYGDRGWGCYEVAILGADGTAIGTGAQNTLDIVNRCGDPDIAAKVCASLTDGGYTDWFMPSIDELSQMYLNKDAINATALANGGSVFSEFSYWSSTEDISFFNGRFNALIIGFSNGAQTSNNKFLNLNVRAIRAF